MAFCCLKTMQGSHMMTKEGFRFNSTTVDVEYQAPVGVFDSLASGGDNELSKVGVLTWTKHNKGEIYSLSEEFSNVFFWFYKRKDFKDAD